MSKGKTLLPDPFPLTPELRAYTDKKCPTLDVEYYHEEFCDHWYANGKMMKSWPATWRTWMRRTYRGAAPGLFGPEDRSIQRKKLRLVPQKDMDLRPVDISPHQAWRDYLEGLAIANGLYVAGRSVQGIIEVLIANDIEYDCTKRPQPMATQPLK